MCQPCEHVKWFSKISCVTVYRCASPVRRHAVASGDSLGDTHRSPVWSQLPGEHQTRHHDSPIRRNSIMGSLLSGLLRDQRRGDGPADLRGRAARQAQLVVPETQVDLVLLYRTADLVRFYYR